jgi:molybdopterin synthase catalytic subunit
MQAEILFVAGPIREPHRPLAEGAGSFVEFRGVVRGSEGGLPISALIYELYPPMAEKVLREIVAELGADCLGVTVIHRHGVIPVGESAIYVRVDSRHRGEGFRFLEELMNRLKQDVPIWKVGSVPC